MNDNIVLTMRGISKEFPGVRALHDVDFTLRKGEIHALMGENGAGKSTLVKCLTGVYIKDAGEIRIDGYDKEAIIRSPQDAQNLGISTVYQEITLCPNLTVAENMFIGRGNYHFVNAKAQEKKADEILERLNIPAKAKQQLGTCSLAIQQMVAIARAVDMECKVLILDEPTSSLDENEVQLLFKLMRDLKSQGVGIIFITHFLDQVYEVCDRITVLRNGELVGEYEIKDMPQVELVSAMLGKDLEDISKLKDEKKAFAGDNSGGNIVYEAKGLSSAEGVKPYDFTIAKGEVNGFTGLLGSGRSESVRAIFAADRVTGGEVKVDGKSVKIKKPIDAMKNGIGYLPEDRKGDGIIPDLSVRENIILALQVLKGFWKPFGRAEAEAFADEYIKLLQIKTASQETPIKSLSGGNQQKVLLAKWMFAQPDVMFLDEPTRGIDVGAKYEIYCIINQLVSEGKSVVMISSELPETIGMSDRIYVMNEGKFVGELKQEEASQESIMACIMKAEREGGNEE